MTLLEESLEDVLATLSDHKYLYRDEIALQDGLSEVLTEAGFEFEREVRLSARDRVDFMIEGIAVEIKRAFTKDHVRRQLTRYASHDDVEAVILVTTKARHFGLPEQINGKPIRVLYLLGGM